MRKYDRQEDSLWKAAFDGNTAKVKTLVRKFGPSKNRELFRDVLLCAVQNGHAPVVKALLAAGANVEQVCNGSMLQHAAWQGHLNVVRVLVAAGAAVDRKVEGRTAFEAALENNHVEVADYLKKQGADWVMLTLLYGCQRGDLAEVKKAIAAGARVDRGYGAFKETPLMRAAGNGRIEVVEFLLKQGANPRVRVEGRTALWHAAASGRSGEVIDALVEAGGDVNEQCDGVTPLMAAATFAPLPVVRRLVELGADIAAIDGTGVDGVLDYARKGKKRDVIAYLSKLGTKSARGPARDLAHAIAQEFGGRPKPVFDGFFIESSVSGFRCQFRVSHPRCSVEISNLEVTDKNFRLGESAWLIIGLKPERRRGRSREVTKARKITGAPVYRSTDLGSIPEEAVLRFCKQHRRAFKRLRLSESDELWIGDTYVQFTWTQSGELRPWDRLKALGALVREIARQVRPESTRGWID
jgi:ankyrin repeat protein